MAIHYKSKNFGLTTLASGIDQTSLSMTVATGDGVKFPDDGTFIGVIWSSQYANPAQDVNAEVVHCTVSGDVVTIERAQEETTARVWVAGSYFAHALTAGKLVELETEILQHNNVTIINADYTVDVADSLIVADHSATDYTITLPIHSADPRQKTIKKSGFNYVYVTPLGGSTIDGATIIALSGSDESIVLEPANGEWKIINSHNWNPIAWVDNQDFYVTPLTKNVLIVNLTAPRNIYLPNVATMRHKDLFIKVWGDSGHTVNVVAFEGQTIEGVATKVLDAPYASMTIMSTSNGWLIKSADPFAPGMVVMFNGQLSNIPAGWTELTTMRGRSPIGVQSGAYGLGSAYGSTTHSHSANVPVATSAHNHYLHDYALYGQAWAGSRNTYSTNVTYGNYGTIYTSAGNNLHPVRGIYFIQKI